MGDGVPCYGALEIVGLLLFYYLFIIYLFIYLLFIIFNIDSVVHHCSHSLSSSPVQ